jgi:MFS family permease
MAQRGEIIAVYAAGVIQGIALVTFPALGAIFIDRADYDLSSTQYGGIFVPQAIAAIVSSLAGAGLIRLLGIKRIYLVGLFADLLAMVVLVLSALAIHNRTLAYGLLLVATCCLGVGFGLTVPAINTFAAAFFPRSVERAVLALNALLGLGTALAPVFVAIFVGLGIWWGLPILVGALTAALLSFSFRLPLGIGAQNSRVQVRKGRRVFPARFWIFAGFALLYGICETMNGNWASIYMTKKLGASATLASVALMMFWGAVTAGRILLTAIEKWFPERRSCVILPFVVAIAFFSIALLPASGAHLGILAFALAGLGCSALLPLTISFAEEELTTIAASVAGGLIAFYQIGYGITAFGVGPLQSGAGLGLNTIYGGTAIVALVMAGFSFIIVRRQAADTPGESPHASHNPNANS